MNKSQLYRKPTVSIGMPVYNGVPFLNEALDSILAQTYRDFELVISDNASTDETESICRAYAASDPRIRYYRQQENLGAMPNFNRVCELSRGQYFKWAACDDVCSPTASRAAVGAGPVQGDVELFSRVGDPRDLAEATYQRLIRDVVADLVARLSAR